MQKKVLAVAAVLALFVCGGAFAQEAEVPETEAPVAEAPAAESSGGGGSSILDTMYAGLDIGTDFGSFYMAPRFGIAPFKKVPKLAFEFLFGIRLGGKYILDPTSNDEYDEWQINFFTPNILVVYTFSDWMIRPYVGAGVGLNFSTAQDKPGKWNTGKQDAAGNIIYEDMTRSLEIENPAFNALITAGAKYAIPNTNFELNAGANLIFRPLSGQETSEFGSLAAQGFFLVLFDIIIGAVYHF